MTSLVKSMGLSWQMGISLISISEALFFDLKYVAYLLFICSMRIIFHKVLEGIKCDSTVEVLSKWMVCS